jgi:protoheme IX farnesyltransferase
VGHLLARVANKPSMKAAAIESQPETRGALSGFIRDVTELIKARLTLLVLLTTAVGFYLGAEGPINWTALLHTVLGTAAAAAGAAALNQWWEHKLDAMMQRTRSRPVPAGRMRPTEAIVIGGVLSIFGVIYLALICNVLSAALAAVTIVVYVFGYTPLKLVSTFNTALGAVPGALPPVIGWAAARGTLDAGAWILFAILFFWQLPHFFAIAWMYRDDYARAGFQMISSDDATGARSASQSVFFCMILFVVAGLPAFIRMATVFYLLAELVLGGIFIAVAMRFLKTRTRGDARRLFITSIIYLPLLLGALVLSKA